MRKSRRTDGKDTEHSEKQRPVVSVPSGRCPVVLEATDPEALDAWAEAVRAKCPRIRLTNGALRQFARQFHFYGTDDHRRVREHFRGQ